MVGGEGRDTRIGSIVSLAESRDTDVAWMLVLRSPVGQIIAALLLCRSTFPQRALFGAATVLRGQQ